MARYIRPCSFANQLTIQCQACSGTLESSKNNINHHAIKLLLSYWANEVSSFIAVHSHDKMTRRGYDEMTINRSAHVLNM